jgi:uracil-DNA glycosylase family 4
MEKPSSCFMCPLDKMSYSFSRPEGKPKLGVAFFGEALGLHEAQEGLPFRPNGESGSLITSIIENQLRHPETGAKLERGDFVWDNALKCKPPDGMKWEGGDFEKEIVSCCSQYNNRSIDLADVRVIIAFGGLAFRSLTGIEGKKRGIGDVRGYVFKSINNKIVVPTYHPAFVRRGNSRYTGALIHDVKKGIALGWKLHCGSSVDTFC